MRQLAASYHRVLVGLSPTIHVFPCPQQQDMDARDKPGHDTATRDVPLSIR